MRFAVVSDIHGNLEAFRTVLGLIEQLDIGSIVCLGDLVGYNADPNACVDIARAGRIACVLGNHDAAASGIIEPYHFNPAARSAALWTREVLTAENKAFLQALPRTLRVGTMVLCHGSIGDTDRYILAEGDARDTFSVMTTLPDSPRVCFFGHTHVKAAYSMRNGALERMLTDAINLSGDTHYLVNPGAVGQPRDGDPRAAFLVYDEGAGKVDFHRVDYDVEACQEKVLRAGLPRRLAERLAAGS